LDIKWNFGVTISSWDILADQQGSIVIDIWSDIYGNFPPTVAKTITGSEKPRLSNQLTNQDTSLTSFTTAVASGDIWRFNVESTPSSVTRVTIAFAYTRTS